MLYEVTLQTTLDNQICLNRFNYRAVGPQQPGNHSNDLATALGAYSATGSPLEFQAGTLLQAIQSVMAEGNTLLDTVIFNSLFVRDLYDGADFVQIPFTGISGTSNGGAAPLFVSTGFRGLKTNLETRNAQKRFVGIPESQILGTGVISPAFFAVMEVLAAALGATVSGSLGDYEPVVLKRERYQVPDSDPPRYAYRAFKDEAVQLANSFSVPVWQPYGRVRSQTSRQIGRGI